MENSQKIKRTRRKPDRFEFDDSKKKNRRVDDQSKLVKSIVDNLKKYNINTEDLDSKKKTFDANRDRNNIWYKISEDYHEKEKFAGPDDDFNEARRLMMAYKVNHPQRPYKTKVIDLLEKVN